MMQYLMPKAVDLVRLLPQLCLELIEPAEFAEFKSAPEQEQ